MKILIIGNGGREHAMAWKVAQSPNVEQVFVAPGNGGAQTETKVKNVPISPLKFKELIDFVTDEEIALTIVGPEAPLAAGIVDQFQAAGLACFGPTAAAARLEASKVFAKDFLKKYHIPTAAYQVFSEIASAKAYLKAQSYPVAIKADGLAAGKGVVIAENKAQAEKAIEDLLASHKIVIEEFLTGEEVSFIALVDGKHILPLASSQDHKRRDDGDKGPNTGGMGAYSPVPWLTPEHEARIMREVMEPTVKGMAQEGHPFKGFLYAGLMIDKAGDPKVLEFNCRMGDPETEPILMRLDSDWVELCLAGVSGKLDQAQIAWKPQAACGVVMAAKGYPENYLTGDVIKGLTPHPSPLPQGERGETVKVFHAGTRYENGEWLTNGGRVLCVTALGDNLEDAQRNAYEAVNRIHWKHAYFRKDIGNKAIHPKLV